MKTVLLLTFFVAVILTGCATFETNAYRTIGSTAITVDTAMNIWGDYVRSGKATQSQETQVASLYSKYQSAMRVTHQLVIGYKSNMVDRTQLETALASLSAAVSQLTIEITNFQTAK